MRGLIYVISIGDRQPNKTRATYMGRYDVVIVLHIRVGPCSTRSEMELPCTLGVIIAQENEVTIVIPKNGEGLLLGFGPSGQGIYQDYACICG